jgi:hypothetical protein
MIEKDRELLSIAYSLVRISAKEVAVFVFLFLN